MSGTPKPYVDKLRKVVVSRVDHLIRRGTPFSSEDVWDAAVRSCAEDLPADEMSPWLVKNNPTLAQAQAATVNLLFNSTVKLARFRDRLWLVYDRGTETFRMKGQSYLYYPSNDEEPAHLKATEFFIPVSKRSDRKLKEPPVRVLSVKDVPENDPSPSSWEYAEPAEPIRTQDVNAAIVRNLKALADHAAEMAGMVSRELAVLLERLEASNG